MTKTRKKKKN